MISKDVLNKVLDVKATGYVQKDSNTLEYGYELNDAIHYHSINTYELAHKCKEWAFKTGWLFQIRTGSTLSVIDIFNHKDQELNMRTQISADTEPEAVFKACEWVYRDIKE